MTQATAMIIASFVSPISGRVMPLRASSPPRSTEIGSSSPYGKTCAACHTLRATRRELRAAAVACSSGSSWLYSTGTSGLLRPSACVIVASTPSAILARRGTCRVEGRRVESYSSTGEGRPPREGLQGKVSEGRSPREGLRGSSYTDTSEGLARRAAP